MVVGNKKGRKPWPTSAVFEDQVFRFYTAKAKVAVKIRS